MGKLPTVSELCGPRECVLCHKDIAQGEQRLVVILLKVGNPPSKAGGHPIPDPEERYDPDQIRENFDGGLGYSRALAICDDCERDKKQFVLPNLRLFECEAKALQCEEAGPSRSVHAGSASAMAEKVAAASWATGDEREQSEIEEAIYSETSTTYSPPPSREDLKGRAGAFLQSSEGLRLRPLQRDALTFWAKGHTQAEIERLLLAKGHTRGVDQSSISRLIRSLQGKIAQSR